MSYHSFSVTKTCGESTDNNGTYFQNSGYPSTFNQVGSCQLTVNKCSSDVCQLRWADTKLRYEKAHICCCHTLSANRNMVMRFYSINFFFCTRIFSMKKIELSSSICINRCQKLICCSCCNVHSKATYVEHVWWCHSHLFLICIAMIYM